VPSVLPASLARTCTADLDGPVSWLDYGGPEGAPLFAAVHGLGGAAWNWAALAPLLTERVRLIAVDLAGHGLTRSGGRGTTVGANRRLLDRWLRQVVGEPVMLIGNSMGGAIALLEGAVAPDLVQRIVLVDPALPRPVFSRVDPRVAASFAIASLPGVGAALVRRRSRRVSLETQVLETLKLCTVDVHRIPRPVIDIGLDYARARQSDELATADLLAAARSVVRLLSRPAPLQRAANAVDAAGIEVLLLHGDRDRLVSVDVARRFAAAHPAWQLAIAEDIGHVPMLEAAQWTATEILDWLPA
jgi:pimeloyl-ACP methyl ester carboxylesterase